MSERAVSEVLSFVLVFALILSAIALVSVGGVGSLEDARDNEQMDNAERAFDVLADNMADLHQRGAPSRATEVNLKDAQLLTGDNVTMTVTVDDTGGSQIFSESWKIRPIVYDGNDERQIVYTAGAVFRTSRDGGLRVRDPPLVFTDRHVLITVVGVNRPTVESYGESTVLVRTNHRNVDTEFENRASEVGEVCIDVTGSRSDLWDDYFESAGLTAAGSDHCYSPASGGINRVYVVYHDIRVNIDQ